MGLRSRCRRLLIGTNRQGAVLTVGIGLLFGVATWLLYPILGVEYWLWPSSLDEWAFAFGFVLLAAGIAFDRAGLLAAW